MNICSSEEMDNYIVNNGLEYTSDIFILFTNVYIRVTHSELEVITNPGADVTYIERTRDKYLCWNYITKNRRELDYDTFWLQFKAFKIVKELNEDFADELLKEILDNELTPFALNSEHLL